MGMNPMSGRGAGYCAGFDVPGYMNAPHWGGFGMAYGRGRGFPGRGGGWGLGGRAAAGRGWRHRFYATGVPGWMRSERYEAPYERPHTKQEKRALENQAEELQSQLDFIRKRLSEIQQDTAAE
jgi:hypothetical protein